MSDWDRRERFEAAYRELYEPICGYTLRRVRDPEDAAEAIAETFATLWRRFDRCPQGEQLRPWLYGVARRVIANQRRGERRRTALGERLVAHFDPAALFGAAGREELLDGMMRARVGRRRPAQPATRRPLVVALAVIAAAALAGGAWALFGSSAHETTSIECSVDGTDTIIPAVSGDPAYDCARILRDDTGTDPPPLAAHDNGTGGVTVLPRSTTPPSGFKRLQAGQDVALIQLQDSLDDYIGGPTPRRLPDHTGP